MKLKTCSTLLLAIALLVISGYSVSAKKCNQRFELGLSANGYVYTGDLSNNQLGNFKDIRPGLGAFIRYNFKNDGILSALRFNYYYGGLKGDDAGLKQDWRKKRAYNFTSPLSEISVMMERNIFWEKRKKSFANIDHIRSRWGLYTFAGVGVAFVDAKRDWSKLDRSYFYRDAPENIYKDSLNKPDNIVLVIPVGLGGRYDVNPHLSVFAEAGYRITFTDNLDGYKYSVYSKKPDGYMTYTLGVNIRFTKNNKDINTILKKTWRNNGVFKRYFNHNGKTKH